MLDGCHTADERQSESGEGESYPPPYAAIEECVINALYHRSYEQREPVEVRVSPDELIVLSYPGPDRSVRLAQLRAGRAVPRRYRNRRIGEFFKELDLTEGRSTGVPKIFRAMSLNGSPPPEFEFDEDHSYFMVRLPVLGCREQHSLELPPVCRPLSARSGFGKRGRRRWLRRPYRVRIGTGNRSGGSGLRRCLGRPVGRGVPCS